VYFWLPKWTGHMYDETLGKWHFWLSMIFFNMISSIGAFGFGLSQLLFLYVVVKCIRSHEKAPQKPWEGADSLEWTHLPTPPPYHTFETQPIIK